MCPKDSKSHRTIYTTGPSVCSQPGLPVGWCKDSHESGPWGVTVSEETAREPRGKNAVPTLTTGLLTETTSFCVRCLADPMTAWLCSPDSEKDNCAVKVSDGWDREGTPSGRQWMPRGLEGAACPGRWGQECAQTCLGRRQLVKCGEGGVGCC